MKALVLAGLLGFSLNAAAQEAQTEKIDESFEDVASCDAKGRDLLVGPIQVASFHDAELARARRACLRSEGGVGLRVAPVIDTPDFYGHIAGAVEFYGSHTLSKSLELFGTLELPRFDYVVNATLTKTKVTLGNATVGAAWNVVRSEGLLVTPTARVLLPTSFLAQNVRLTGLELGVAASSRPTTALELHAHLGVQGTIGLSAGPMLPTGAGFATVGLSFMPFEWGAIVLDVQAHGGERDTIDYVAPTLALRFNPGKTVNVEVGGGVPLLGAARQLAVGGVRVGWTY